MKKESKRLQRRKITIGNIGSGHYQTEMKEEKKKKEKEKEKSASKD